MACERSDAISSIYCMKSINNLLHYFLLNCSDQFPLNIPYECSFELRIKIDVVHGLSKICFGIWAKMRANRVDVIVCNYSLQLKWNCDATFKLILWKLCEWHLPLPLRLLLNITHFLQVNFRIVCMILSFVFLSLSYFLHSKLNTHWKSARIDNVECVYVEWVTRILIIKRVKSSDDVRERVYKRELKIAFENEIEK